MKVLYQILLLATFSFSCSSNFTRRSESITPKTRIQIAYFHVTMQNGREFYINAVNFVDTGDMWVLWTEAAPDHPEFLNVFQIDHGYAWTHPFSGRSGFKEMSVKEYVADLFENSLKMKIKTIDKLGK